MKRFVCFILAALLCFTFCSCSFGYDENADYEYSCTLIIECKDVLGSMDKLNKDKSSVIPANGVVFGEAACGFNEGESVYDVLRRVCTQRRIHLDASITPVYGTAYIKGIHNLYEFDCGEASGWIYSVNGETPGFGCSEYILKDGDSVVFHYCTG